MPRSVTFEVGVTFCDDRSFTHEIDTLAAAMKEYTDMLAVGVEPELITVPGDKHVRLVTFLARNEQGEITQHITSPVFECDDRNAA